jgi:hypothetical protein
MKVTEDQLARIGLTCPCDSGDKYRCKIHVHCDDFCKALADPQTLDEFKATLEHWEDHGLDSGCSHGY